MPNHVVNILDLVGYQSHMKSVLDLIRSEDEKGNVNNFDFNKIRPMPEEIRHITSPVQIVSKKEYDKQQKELKTGINNFRRNITKKMSDDYFQRFGADNWYDWALANWGTKWGSYDTEMGEIEPLIDPTGYVKVRITFQTAWSCSIQIIRFLSDLFPTITFTLTYADEDCGHNCGRLTLKDANDKDVFQPEGGSNEAMEIYFECWGGEEQWEMVDGEWKWMYE